MSQSPPPPGRSSGAGTTVLLVVLVILLVAVGGFAGLLVWRGSAQPRAAGSGPRVAQAPPSPTTPSPAQSPGSSSTDRGSMPAVPAGLARFYHQRLRWHACGTNRCASLTVPLDYAHPGGRTIELAVLDVPARDQRHKLGALVVNPGGPGGSGVQYAAAAPVVLGTVLPTWFDIVGFDPRGVGQSTPLRCASTAELDHFVASDPDPDTAAERRQMDREVHRLGEGCLHDSGALARHMSTVEVARDMDVLRAALHEPKLDYFGASYGTFLGATYANLFPHRVGRMVLDGAINPALSNEQLSLQQAHGFEVALRSYVADCVHSGSCFLGSTVDQGTRRIRQFLHRVEAHPLPTDTSRRLTAGTAMLGIWMPLYVRSYWPQLSAGLQQAMQQGSGSKLLSLADMYTSRGPNGYLDNSLEVLYDVNCLDHDDAIPTSQVPSHFAEFLKASPTFGKAFAFSLSTCSAWPIHTGNASHALHAKGAPPIVVIGTTRDPATPLEWARALARQLDSGVLVTRNGDGHTGFHQGNPCVDHAVQGYLVHGKVPRNGLAC
ncbi:MAG TPA: alpha/beta hydrolase [Marmoricola sp.]|nr:alpha/beta hydrolase [Marmoricola sp.]